MKSAFEVKEIKSSQPILIVDRIGVIGEALAKEFAKDFQVLLVSSISSEIKIPNIFQIHFKKRIPKVPVYRYSKIFLIDDGQSVTRESAFSFVQLARESNAQLFFIGSMRNTDVKHADSITTEYASSKVLVFGDLFDKNIFFDKDQAITKYILNARKNGRVYVEGSGLNISYPMTFTDTIKLIIKAAYLNIPQKIIILTYPHAYSDITLANIFQKVDPSIKLDFIKETKRKNIFLPKNSQFAIGKYDLEKKIRELDLDDFENREVKIIKKNGKKKSILKPILFVLTTFLFLMLLPFFTTSAYSYLGQREIRNAISSFEEGDFNKAKKQLSNADSFFETGLKTSEPLIAEASFFGFENDAQKIKEKITTGKELSEAGIELLDGAELISGVFSNSSKDPKNDFQKAGSSIKNSMAVFSKVKAEGELPREIDEKISNLEPVLNLFINSQENLTEIFGFESEKKYLVLFQDTSELRPAGGVTEFLGLIKVSNGKIAEFKIQSADELDKNINVDSEPPYEIRRYVPEKSLLIKDSGFDPDFVKSAISVSNVYERSTRERVDGVIAINSNFIKNLIPNTGSLTVNNQKIEFEDISSSLNNKDQIFYKGLGDAILQNLSNGKIKPINAIEGVGKSIISKDIVFAFADPGLQNIFTANSWSSSIWDNREIKAGTINDYFGLSESNLGKNNVNQFVSRSVNKKITILDSGKVSSAVEIIFKNSSGNLNYKNYLRVILPEGSTINSVMIDRVGQVIENPVTDFRVYESINFSPPKGLEIQESREMNKSIFSFFINIPANSSKNIVIDYNLPYSVLANQQQVDYSLMLFKQPGIESYPLNFTLSFPNNFFIATGKSNTLVEVDKDKTINTSLSQK